MTDSKYQPGSEHTPTPWTSRKRDVSVTLCGPGDIEVMSTSWHGSIRARYPLKAESLANAAFVLEAVNSHAALKSRVEELTKALEIIASGTKDWEYPFRAMPESEMRKIASAALSLEDHPTHTGEAKC